MIKKKAILMIFIALAAFLIMLIAAALISGLAASADGAERAVASGNGVLRQVFAAGSCVTQMPI